MEINKVFQRQPFCTRRWASRRMAATRSICASRVILSLPLIVMVTGPIAFCYGRSANAATVDLSSMYDLRTHLFGGSMLTSATLTGPAVEPIVVNYGRPANISILV